MFSRTKVLIPHKIAGADPTAVSSNASTQPGTSHSGMGGSTSLRWGRYRHADFLQAISRIPRYKAAGPVSAPRLRSSPVASIAHSPTVSRSWVPRWPRHLSSRRAVSEAPRRSARRSRCPTSARQQSISPAPSLPASSMLSLAAYIAAISGVLIPFARIRGESILCRSMNSTRASLSFFP